MRGGGGGEQEEEGGEEGARCMEGGVQRIEQELLFTYC